MGWKSFIASIVGSLAWPMVLIILIIVLRKHIFGLAERLEELSLPGGAKAVFQKQLEAAREEAQNLPLPAQPTGLVPPTEERLFLQLVATVPEAAIVEAYKRIEIVLTKIANFLPPDCTKSAEQIMSELHKRGLIDEAAVELFNTLRRARNVAAHVRSGQISSVEAKDYGDHAERLAGRLYFVLGGLQAQSEGPALRRG